LLTGSIPKFVLSALYLSRSGEVACQIVIYSEGIRIIAQRVKKNLDRDGSGGKSRIFEISNLWDRDGLDNGVEYQYMTGRFIDDR
jgi:hypothetical protein